MTHRLLAAFPAADEPELATPVDILAPPSCLSPVVLSSPHSGRIYPETFLALSRLDSHTLRRSEDAFVDDLFSAIVGEAGAPMVRALFPRAFMDVNREPFELDPRMFVDQLPAYANTRSLRVAGGLGTIARIVGEAKEIYAQPLEVDSALRRIEALYRPYHAVLAALLDEAQRLFGLALLIDCHSMPSIVTTPTGQERVKADFVLGDRFGASCASVFTMTAERELRRLGYQVQRNKPYAGGFITEHYGSPEKGRHALQIEVNRALYMDEAKLEKKPLFPDVARDLGRVATALSAATRECAARQPKDWRSAAE